MNETDLELGEYISTLSLASEPTPVYETDGASLWQVGEDHFILASCTEHEGHQGPAMLSRVLPADWAPFHRVANPSACYQVEHYGPPC